MDFIVEMAKDKEEKMKGETRKRNPLFNDAFIEWLDAMFESSKEDRITMDFYKDRSYIITINHDMKKYA